MVGRRAVIALVGGVVLGGLPSWTLAQVDPAGVVGQWEGQQQGAPGDPTRTLRVERVREHEGRWTAAAHYGVTGRRLVPVEVAATPSPSRRDKSRAGHRTSSPKIQVGNASSTG